MSENYKVYMHVFPNGKKYIGITMQEPEKRWRYGGGYYFNKHMNNAIKKYGWKNIEHIIVLEGLTKQQAEEREIEYIKNYKANETNFGYNVANGGFSSGRVSEVTKRNLSEQRKGKNNPMYGVRGSEHPRAVVINQYGLDGKFIKTWGSSVDIEKETGITKSKVIATCRGKLKSAGGFQWKYNNGEALDIGEYKTKSVLGSNNPMYGRKGKNNNKSKPVDQYDLNGNLVASFVSATEADERTGISFKNITSCCRGERAASKGYVWKFR